jgi:tripartite-type tricarboxylate transporter receptor subunit TctC
MKAVDADAPLDHPRLLELLEHPMHRLLRHPGHLRQMRQRNRPLRRRDPLDDHERLLDRRGRLRHPVLSFTCAPPRIVPLPQHSAATKVATLPAKSLMSFIFTAPRPNRQILANRVVAIVTLYALHKNVDNASRFLGKSNATSRTGSAATRTRDTLGGYSMPAHTRIATLLAGAAAIAMLPAPCPQWRRRTIPSRPIELIVTFGPGGGADLMGGRWRGSSSRSSDVSIPVTNVAGASGNAGLTRLNTSPADGYTLGTLISLTVASWASELGDVSADDFDIIAMIQNTPSMLFVRPESGFETVEDLFDMPARTRGSHRGHLRLRHPGRRDRAVLLAEGGVEMSNVPFEAPAERYASTVGGHTDVLYEEPGDIVQFLAVGPARAAGGLRQRAPSGLPRRADGGRARLRHRRPLHLPLHRGARRHPRRGDRAARGGDHRGSQSEEWQPSVARPTPASIRSPETTRGQMVDEFHEMIAERLDS